jgi:ArsR family transcriptional regulator, arsenate/arsenite/antimonite-responsive transcriptional repressor
VKDTAQFFKILGDEARLKMLWLLFNHRELCVCDFVAALGITQSKASRHLRTLWHGGLVTDRRDGLWSHYSLRPVESDLKRAQLDVLRAKLAKQPGAAEVLDDLRTCMARKDRGAMCAADGTCGTPKARKPAVRRPTTRSGGKR